ncbi:RecT family recombinase [Thermus caliditerrae]|uniref:RecT family recombinase n=1 Tax=Thermus caliditerrae TaxID=1330700 RepID=UPI001F366C82|nr:RecT family recombinase [Thermus caliditerrae]
MNGKEELALWEEAKRVLREMYGKRLTEAEFSAFLLVARKLGLDPVSREIIPQVREGSGGRQVSFIISRDGYLKAAMRDPDYAGLQSMVVREGDHFEIHPSEGRVVHRFGAKRGAILGAWAISYHRKRPPVIYFADFQEYVEANKNSPTWKQYPSAMIQKVAEVGALRRQFNLSGVVAAEEVGAEPLEAPADLPATGEEPHARLGSPSPAMTLPAPTPKPIAGLQARAIAELYQDLGLKGPLAREVASRRVEREVASLKELSHQEAEDLLAYLEELMRALESLSPQERGERIRAWLAAHERGLPEPEELVDAEAEVLFEEEEA